MQNPDFISLTGNVNSLQSLASSNWLVNEMKRIQFFDGYISNTYLVDSRNEHNADLLSHISKSEIYGCFFDFRSIDGNIKINQLAVSCSQGVVIFNSIEKDSNKVMKDFFSTIVSKKCYVRGVTNYHKFLISYGFNINKMENIDTNEYYNDFIKFRQQSTFCNFTENYRSNTKNQQTSATLVLDCLINAFEAVCIDYYYSHLVKKRNSLNPASFAPELRSQPSYPPGMGPPGINMDYPPGLGQQAPSFPPGMNVNAKPRQINPKSIGQRHMSMQPQNTYGKFQQNQPPPENKPKKKETPTSTFGPISVDILKSNEKKQSEINKQFWKNLDTLIAILSSTKKIEVEDGKYFCKTCNENFVSYEFLLEHCWNEHKSALE